MVSLGIQHRNKLGRVYKLFYLSSQAQHQLEKLQECDP